MSVALALFAAHALADFPLQPTSMARRKLDEPAVRLAHCAIHLCVTAVLLLPLTSIEGSLAAATLVAVNHFVVDSRRWVSPDAGGFDGYPMAVDQTLHLLALYVVTVVMLP